jgi:phosphate transport system substrate-binding protein
MVSLLKQTALVSIVALAAGLTACPAPTTTTTTTTTTTGTATTAATGGAKVTLSGAGASAPNPVYQRWFSDFGKANNAQVSYQSVGSGAGVKQFLAGTVDFGATDDPLKAEDAKKYADANGGVNPIQIPTTGLFVVMAYNVDGVDNLKLSREAFCGILDGSIKTWNDPKIAKDNAGVTLPNLPVTPVYRSDGSGTTAILTNHVVAACPGWKAGAGKSIEWPVGTGAKGNEGVTAQIKQTKGGVGYVEYSFAKENALKMASLVNKAGEFIAPSPEAAAKALEGAKLGADLSFKDPDPAQKGAYPIVSLTYLLLKHQYDDAAKADTLKKMVAYTLKDGKAAAGDLGYIPLPDDMVAKVTTASDAVKVAGK